MTRASTRDLLRLYRVRDWLHFLPLPLAGWIAGGARSPTALAGGLTGWALALAYMSAVNQAFDDRLDRRPDKNPVGVGISRRDALLRALPAALGSLAAVALGAPSRWPAAVLLLAAATAYSAPPRLKRVPIVGTLWNVVIALPGLTLADTARADHPSFAAVAGVFSLLLLASQLVHEAEDRDDDRAGAISTVAVLTGAKGALTAATTTLAVLPLVAWWLSRAMHRRALFTAAVLAFSAGWVAALATRLARGDLRGLRDVRLRYRHTAVALGAVAFALTLD